MHRSWGLMMALVIGCGSVGSSPDAGVDAQPSCGSDLTEWGISISPTAARFPVTALGTTSAPITFTVTNLSCDNSGALSVSTDGPNEDAFALATSSCAFPLRHLDVCQINVVFRPSLIGVSQARLTVRSQNARMFTVLLDGAGASSKPDAAAD